MADFMAFGRGTVDLTKTICGGLNKKDVADFLSAQQKAIQNDRINKRLTGQQQQQKPGGKTYNALDRMRAMAGLK